MCANSVFPLKDRSSSMRSFMRAAETSGSHFLTSLRLGRNHLEFDYLLSQIAKEMDVSRLPVYEKEMPDLHELARNGHRGAVFLNEMTTEIQTAIVSSGNMQHLRGIIVVLDNEPVASLTPAFLGRFTRRLTWPEWKNRKDDHLRLLEEIHRRIEMPGGVPKPSYTKKSNALAAILKHPFTGTDEVAECFRGAIKRYVATGDTYALQACHFFPDPQQEISALSAAAE